MAGRRLLDNYFVLTRLRLHWYIRASGNLVLRYWQWFLIAGLIVPNPPVFGVFVAPAQILEAIIAGGHGWLAQTVFVLAVQFAALLWIIPQRRLLLGGSFTSFASTLPLSKGLSLGVDLTLLVAANSLMLISVLIATYVTLVLRDGAYRISVLWMLFGMALVVQLAALDRRVIGVPVILLADGFLGWSLTSPPGAGRWLLLVPTLAGAAAALLGMDKVVKRNVPTFLPAVSPMLFLMRLLEGCAPSLLVQCKAVAAKRGPTAFRLSATFALAFGVDRLVAVFRFDQRALPTDIVAMAIIALILSGLYRTLREAHASMCAYQAALPMSSHYWPLRDTAFMLLLGLAPLCILLMPVLFHGHVATLPVVFALVLAYQALLALLRLPLVFGGPRAVVYAVLLTVAWSGTAMAVVAQ